MRVRYAHAVLPILLLRSVANSIIKHLKSNKKMKSLKTFTTVMGLMAVVLVWTACKKEQSLSNSQQSPSNPTLNNPTLNAHNGGVVEDNPEFVSRIPLIISSNFMQQNTSGVP